MSIESVLTSESDKEKPAGMFRFVRGAGIAMIGRLLGRGFGYIGQVILARILQPELFGLYAIGWTILRLVIVIAPLGLDNGVIRFGSKYYWMKNHLRFKGIYTLSLGGALFSGVLFSIVVYFTAPWLAINFFQKPELVLILRGFALVFPLATSLRVLVATSSVTQKMLCGGIAEDIVQPVIQISIFLIIWKLVGGIESALLATVLSFAVSVIVGKLCVARLIPETFIRGSRDYTDTISLVRFSLTSMVAVSFGVLNLWGNRLVIGYFRTDAEMGIFQSISLIVMFTAIVMSGIKAIMAPMIAELYQKRETKQLNSLTEMVSKWILYLTMPFFIAVIAAPREFLVITFGESYQSGAVPMVVMMLSQIFYLVFGISDQLLLMSGNQKEWLIISIVTFLISFFLNIVVVPIFGLLGVAWVSVFSSLIVLLWGGFRVRKLLSIWPYTQKQFKPLIASVISFTVVSFLVKIPVSSLFLKMLFIGLLAVVLFGSFIFLLGFDQEDRLLFQAVIRKFGLSRNVS